MSILLKLSTLADSSLEERKLIVFLGLFLINMKDCCPAKNLGGMYMSNVHPLIDAIIKRQLNISETKKSKNIKNNDKKSKEREYK